MDELTKRQAEMLEFIVERFREGLPSPTTREIAEHFGFSSTTGVRDHLKAIERKGYIERHSGSARGIELAEHVREQVTGIPLLGEVAAGVPIEAIEEVEAYLTLDSVYGAREGLFALRVKGESMIGAGILDGDYAICRQGPDVPNGAIGVAVIDGEATVKYIYRRGNLLELVPANPDFQPLTIDLAGELGQVPVAVVGRVVGIQRSL